MYLLRQVSILLLIVVACASNPGRESFREIITRARETDSSSLVLIHRNERIHSDFSGVEDQPLDVQSVTKSIAALAIARLIDEKKISSFEAPMSLWIPSWGQDAQKAKITLRMIMSHTSGLPDVVTHLSDSKTYTATTKDFFKSKDLVEAAEQTPLVGVPGEQFLYSSIGSSTLTRVISQASGVRVSAYVNEAIFKPLGITDFKWSKDSAGHELTSGGLSLSTADLEKLGRLVLQRGSYNGTQVISSGSLQKLISKSQRFADYGLNWWLSEDGKVISARGYGGQFLVVIPEEGLIAIRTKNIWRLDPMKLEAGKFREFPELISRWRTHL